MAAAFARPDTGVNLTDGANPEWVQAAITTGSLFAVLGVQPALGRAFLPDEEKAGNNRVTILSDSLWRRHFNGDRSVIGKTITLDARSYTVVGVLPAAFEFPTPHSVDSVAKPKDPIGLYVPAVLGKHRGGHNYRVIARLKPGPNQIAPTVEELPAHEAQKIDVEVAYSGTPFYRDPRPKTGKSPREMMIDWAEGVAKHKENVRIVKEQSS